MNRPTTPTGRWLESFIQKEPPANACRFTLHVGTTCRPIPTPIPNVVLHNAQIVHRFESVMFWWVTEGGRPQVLRRDVFFLSADRIEEVEA